MQTGIVVNEQEQVLAPATPAWLHGFNATHPILEANRIGNAINTVLKTDDEDIYNEQITGLSRSLFDSVSNSLTVLHCLFIDCALDVQVTYNDADSKYSGLLDSIKRVKWWAEERPLCTNWRNYSPRTGPLLDEYDRGELEGLLAQLAFAISKYIEMVVVIAERIRKQSIRVPEPIDHYAALREAAKSERLKGNEMIAVETLCDNDGVVSVADLAKRFDWGVDHKSNWNSLRSVLCDKLKSHGWKVATHDRSAVAERCDSVQK